MFEISISSGADSVHRLIFSADILFVFFAILSSKFRIRKNTEISSGKFKLGTLRCENDYVLVGSSITGMTGMKAYFEI